MTETRRGGVTTVSSVAAATLVAVWLFWPSPTEVIRTPVPIPEDQAFHPVGLFDVSRDGSLLVYRREGEHQSSELWARRLEESDARLIPGSEGAGLPAVSPDGLEVAFEAGGWGHSAVQIGVVPLKGGAARTLTGNATQGGVRWSPDGVWIYYTNADLGLSRVPAKGGRAEVLTRVDSSDGVEMHWGVEVLPGGREIVYTASLLDRSNPRIEVLDLKSGTVKDLWSGSFPRYSETGSGLFGRRYLLFMERDEPNLLVAELDVEQLELKGTPERLVGGLARPAGWPSFAASSAGTVWYGREVGGVTVSPVWVLRDGSTEPIDTGWTFPGNVTYSSLALAPEDDRLIVSIPAADERFDLWVKPLGTADDQLWRLTGEGSLNYRPTWSPDGASLTFISDRAGQADLWRISADGAGEAERILDRPDVVRNGFVTPADGWLVFREGEAPVADIMALRSVTGEEVRVVATERGERSPELSPNGRWLAYTSDELGEWHVWVTDFLEEGGGTWHVSPAGGEEPVWANSGRELFYRDLSNQLVSVRISEDPLFRVVGHEVLFSMQPYLGSDGRAQYDVGADDRRFVMLRLQEGGEIELLWADNLLEDLDR